MAYPIWQATITDDNGNVLPGAEITVVNEETGLNAQLYSTRNGTSKTNPFFATVDGFAQFYAAPGLYRITATDGGTGTTQTFRYVRLVEVGTAAGEVMQVGAFGLGSSGNPPTLLDINDLNSTRIFRYSTSSVGFPTGFGEGLYLHGTDQNSGYANILLTSYSVSKYYIMRKTAGVWFTDELRHTGNTIVDPNGFIKAASPIVSLYRDRAESNGSDELSGMQFERIATGHYRLTGVPELSRDGWYIETPKDRNGNVYFTLDYVESEGQLDIRTYTPDYSTGRATNGDPVDIIDGRFVSLRFAESQETTPPEEA